MSSKDNQRLSRQQEKRVAKVLGGKRHAYSGSRPEQDGDGHVGDNIRLSEYLLIECKRTNATTQITLKEKDLRKHWVESAQQGREPLFAVELAGRDYALLDLHFVAELFDEVRRAREVMDMGADAYRRHTEEVIEALLKEDE